ncbi:unnamed protein product, partial [Discosporangium mesarthrocarpum]
ERQEQGFHHGRKFVPEQYDHVEAAVENTACLEAGEDTGHAKKIEGGQVQGNAGGQGQHWAHGQQAFVPERYDCVETVEDASFLSNVEGADGAKADVDGWGVQVPG